MNQTITISEYTDADRSTLIRGGIDLQETERAVSDLCLPGTEVAEKYLEQLLKLNAQNSGKIFVAKIGDKAVGFISCRLEHDDSVTTIDAANDYGYISDAWTDKGHRNQGIFTKLHEAAIEHFTQFNHISIVKLNVLQGNKVAFAAYDRTGYEVHEVVMFKKIR
jgi:ribosomal protein S18 acetylase RimI-like enzyme